VTDNQVKDRVRSLLRGASGDGETASHAMPVPEPAFSSDQALQVLTLAQRTAEDHVAAANRQAERSRAEAKAAAEQMALEAQAHVRQLRGEADKVLCDARAMADLAARDAQAQAAEIRRQAELVLAGARSEAERIVAEGRDRTERLTLQAEQRYEDAVGGLSMRREALQNQIEALEIFDAEYRSRLTTFLQNQMRALWAEQPQVIDLAPAMSGGPVTLAEKC